VIPCGLAKTPSQFLRDMNRQLASGPEVCEFVDDYVVDVLIYCLTRTDHLDHVRTVPQLLQEAGLKLMKSKSKWFCEEIEY
jgi:hypothetical protein